MLAIHPGNRDVEQTSELLVLNRFGEREVGSRFNRIAHRGCSICMRFNSSRLGCRSSSRKLPLGKSGLTILPLCQTSDDWSAQWEFSERGC